MSVRPRGPPKHQNRRRTVVFWRMVGERWFSKVGREKLAARRNRKGAERKSLPVSDAKNRSAIPLWGCRLKIRYFIMSYSRLCHNMIFIWKNVRINAAINAVYIYNIKIIFLLLNFHIYNKLRILSSFLLHYKNLDLIIHL